MASALTHELAIRKKWAAQIAVHLCIEQCKAAWVVRLRASLVIAATKSQTLELP